MSRVERRPVSGSAHSCFAGHSTRCHQHRVRRRSSLWGVTPSRTARDQHQPASSRAIATLAIGVTLAAVDERDPPVVQPSVALVTAGPGRRRGQLPAVTHGLADRVAGAVVPGGFDEQPAGVTVAGLGDRPLDAGLLPEEYSVGVRPTNAPMVLPVNRCQSPISTASANPVRVLTPAQASQPAHERGELAVGGHLFDGVRQAGHGGPSPSTPPRSRRRTPSGSSDRSAADRLLTQPHVVHTGPGLPAVVDDARGAAAACDSRCRARIRSPRQSSRARTRSRAASCSTVGIDTAVISSSRSSRARCIASRASVLTRSPLGRCSLLGAATSHRIPAAVSARYRPKPVGPAS